MFHYDRFSCDPKIGLWLEIFDVYMTFSLIEILIRMTLLSRYLKDHLTMKIIDVCSQLFLYSWLIYGNVVFFSSDDDCELKDPVIFIGMLLILIFGYVPLLNLGIALFLLVGCFPCFLIVYYSEKSHQWIGASTEIV